MQARASLNEQAAARALFLPLLKMLLLHVIRPRIKVLVEDRDVVIIELLGNRHCGASEHHSRCVAEVTSPCHCPTNGIRSAETAQRECFVLILSTITLEYQAPRVISTAAR